MDENAGIAQSHSQAIAIKGYHAHLASAGRASLATYTLIGANVILFVAAVLGGAGVVTANPAAQSAFKDAVAQLQHGTYTPAEFAKRLESDVLPKSTGQARVRSNGSEIDEGSR